MNSSKYIALPLEIYEELTAHHRQPAEQKSPEPATQTSQPPPPPPLPPAKIIINEAKPDDSLGPPGERLKQPAKRKWIIPQ